MSYDEPDDDKKRLMAIGQPRLSFRGLQMLAGLLGTDGLLSPTGRTVVPETVNLQGPSSKGNLEDINSHDYSKAVMPHRQIPRTDADREALDKAEKKRQRKAKKKMGLRD